ncbi:MAG: hypothetical protein NC548_12710 [Lachnospiraceae bacterium]|nr:hypothetical protein [Lachnospiraceae bacterium]MCM1230749.1 hypothetical protein [Ruminococcus flavefaciens]
MANSDIKQHVSIEERLKWNKFCDDFTAHLGSNGVTSHALATGSVAGFSQCDFTPEEKTKLAGIQAGALNNPHPATHSYTEITGLAGVAHTGAYSDLTGVPTTFIAGGGNADTVGGIRITIDQTSPRNPTNLKDIWFDLASMTIKVYAGGEWVSFGAVFG